MDKNAIKKYAVWARRELISRVSQKAQQFGITEKIIVDANVDSINGHILSVDEKKQRQALIAEIKQKGYEHVMEEVAYTWFNRFSALRFMEVNGYLPTHVRVFTDNANHFKPQILTEAIHLELDGLDRNRVYDLKEANDDDTLYKYLLISQCNALSAILPGMFQRIADYTELLFPDNLLREGSVIEQMITLISEDDWKDQVQIIGWLYQYYISEKHDQIINIYKGTIKKEDIPAATQLFTTDWVVRYMVDNSLGRYWIEHNPQSKLADKLDFFVTPKGGIINYINEKVRPEELTFLDPCMGSGHILVYAFDVLMEIYREDGYNDSDAARSIVQNNLFGLDIDERAYQLAYFAVMIKARQYTRRFLKENIHNNLCSIEESNNINKDEVLSIRMDKVQSNICEYLVSAFKQAKEIGSLLIIEPKDYSAFTSYLDKFEIKGQLDVNTMKWLTEIKPLLLQFSKQAEILSNKYTVVCTNPPYMNKLEHNLKDFVTTHYKDYSSDLFSAFMYRNFSLCKQNGYSAFMTPFVWMFIKTYEKLRKYIIDQKAITTLVQMEYSAFEEATVPICTFVLKNGIVSEPAYCFKLSDFKGGMEVQKQKVLDAIANTHCGYFYEANQSLFSRVPNSPIIYSVSYAFFSIYDTKDSIANYGETREGMATANNDLFLKLWFETKYNQIGFHVPSREAACKSNKKWFPYNKGGNYRKWYGNNEYIVNWYNDGYQIQHYYEPETGRIRSHNYNLDYIFCEGITWTSLSSGNFSARYSDIGKLADSKGSMLYLFDSNNTIYFLALLNSVISNYILSNISQTIDFKPGRISEIPVIIGHKEIIDKKTKQVIGISKSDWDSFETSWDFQKHPLIRSIANLAEAYDSWNAECTDRFNTIKSNEKELNRIFIDIYGLQNELTPEVEDKDVTVRLADKKRDIRSLISYAVGCMFGRYSLDVDGLAYAGGDWDASKYATFPADADNIIPICDDEYFDDDIIGRFVKFIETVYGKETLDKNLHFIADALGGSGQPMEVIRSYFLNGFYADHLKIYQKRPIYWLFDSGKKNGFKALIYMHRYAPDTIARMRTDYVHEQQARYRNAIADLEHRIEDASTAERVKLNKQLIKLQGQSDEIREYEEKIHHLADQMIRIDLDDGVKHNYEIFGDVLAKIK